MVMAQSLYRVLRQRSPGVEIDVVAPPWSLPVLARMPEVRRGVELAVGHGELGLRRRRSLGLQLRAEHYTRSIVLPRSAKAALVPWFAGVPRRTGFRGELRYGLLNDRRVLDERLDQTVKRFVSLGLERDEPLPETLEDDLRPALSVDRTNLDRLREANGLDAARPLVALMPGAEYGPAKRWPVESYAELAARVARLGAHVVVLGSAKEEPLGNEIEARAADERVRNLCGRTALADVVDLAAACSAAVTNDSGLLHVAAAAGAHVIAIYGSSTPAFTPPLTAAKDVLYLGLDCSPCFARTCPLGHLRCLREISVANVLAVVEKRLERAAARTEPESNG
jgi:heptosyltransferase-2